jgi:colanic acid/amylovoran biosynthesis glycosyltransferase
VKPLVASYCTYFLKPEMRHIYRQLTSLRKVETFVITKFRENAIEYPFPDIEVLQKSRISLVRRTFLKYVSRSPSIVYRGEFEAGREVLLRRDPDLMHIYFGNTGVHLLPLIERWDRPCVVSFNGMDVQRRESERGYEMRLRRLLRLVPVILVRSRSIAERLIELECDPLKIRLNRTGIPLDDFPYAPRRVPVTGAWKIVQACRLVVKKGLPTALRAFALFLRKFPNTRFVIAGEGPQLRELQELVCELRIEQAVSFAGFLNQSELRRLFEQSHLFVHPSEMAVDSNQEGVPNSMLEAMATGLPVVATMHGGIPEAVTDGVSGLLVPERDHERLANSLIALVENPIRWQEMGRAASRMVTAEFAQSRQIEILESVYFEAIQQWQRNRADNQNIFSTTIPHKRTSGPAANFGVAPSTPPHKRSMMPKNLPPTK